MGPSPQEQRAQRPRPTQAPLIREIEAFKTGSTGACVHRGGRVPNLSIVPPRPSTLSRAQASECPRPLRLHLHPLSRASPPLHPSHLPRYLRRHSREKRAATAGQASSLGTDACLHPDEPGNAPAAAVVVAWPIRQNRVPTPTPAPRCSPPTRAMLLLDLLLTEPVQPTIPLRRLPPMPTSTTLTACPWPPT